MCYLTQLKSVINNFCTFHLSLSLFKRTPTINANETHGGNMSRKLQKKAHLAGYYGPFATNKKICDLVEPYGQHLIFHDAAEQTNGYIRDVLMPKTDDGYTWYYGVTFALKRIEFVILFPWSRYKDFEKTGGSQFDRRPALYTNRRMNRMSAKSLTAINAVVYTFVLKTEELTLLREKEEKEKEEKGEVRRSIIV